jgi:hypothetical protein
VENIGASVLSESESNVLEGYINYEEASKILQNMAIAKARRHQAFV